MFDIGDRVRCLVDSPDDNDNITVGSMGTVCGFDDYVNYIYVDWDDDVGGHNCEGMARQSHGWNVPPEGLELMDDDEPFECDDDAFRSFVFGNIKI